MPKRRIVISNTTPIISLALIGHLELLKELYGEVVVPSAVTVEILAAGQLRTDGIRLGRPLVAKVLQLANEEA